MEKINSVIEKILIELGYDYLYYSGILKRNWNKVVGELIAKVSIPDRIENEILFIKCFNPAWKQELYFFKEEIIKNVNNFFTKKIIDDLKIFIN